MLKVYDFLSKGAKGAEGAEGDLLIPPLGLLGPFRPLNSP